MTARTGKKLIVLAISVATWLMLTNVMGASGLLIDTEQSKGSFSAYNPLLWTQTNRSDFAQGALFSVDINKLPGNVVLNKKTEYLFAFESNNQRTFWRYNTTARAWATMAQTPLNIRNGASLSFTNTAYIFALRGAQRNYWRYNISANSWATMANTPDDVGRGGFLAYDGGMYIYSLQGNTGRGFWRYNIASNSWTTLANTPATVQEGAALVYGASGYLYAIQSNNQVSFWRYNISANSWATMANTPQPINLGGSLTFNGYNFIYACAGGSQRFFFRYNITSNTWSYLSNTPGIVRSGGCLAYDYLDGVYAFAGSSNLFWRYNITTNLWSSEPNTLGTVNGGAAMTAGPALFRRNGWINSAVFDTNIPGAKEWGLFWNESTPLTTDINFETRASDSLFGGYPNAPWVNIGSTSPVLSGLPSGRYIQWRAVLTTANLRVTPVLQEVRIYYF